jgi:hypothetical protein
MIAYPGHGWPKNIGLRTVQYLSFHVPHSEFPPWTMNKSASIE